MNKKLLLALFVIVFGGSVAVGTYVYELKIPGNVTVVETPAGEYKLEAFEDAPCTVSLTSVDWGSMRSGESKQIEFYVKNTGKETMTSITVEVESPVQYSGGHAYGSLAPDQSLKVTANLYISPTAAPGDYSAEIKITCTG